LIGKLYGQVVATFMFPVVAVILIFLHVPVVEFCKVNVAAAFGAPVPPVKMMSAGTGLKLVFG
jgi:hypothetical protein